MGRAVAGATPQSEGLVRVRAQVCFHPCPRPPWGPSRPAIRAGRRFSAPSRRGRTSVGGSGPGPPKPRSAASGNNPQNGKHRTQASGRSGRRSAIGPPRKRTTRARSWRRRWAHAVQTRLRPHTGARTCSSGGAGSWTTERRIWRAGEQAPGPDLIVVPSLRRLAGVSGHLRLYDRLRSTIAAPRALRRWLMLRQASSEPGWPRARAIASPTSLSTMLSMSFLNSRIISSLIWSRPRSKASCSYLAGLNPRGEFRV